MSHFLPYWAKVHFDASGNHGLLDGHVVVVVGGVVVEPDVLVVVIVPPEPFDVSVVVSPVPIGAMSEGAMRRPRISTDGRKRTRLRRVT
jgi:hypothetical protein